eukprot:TRINITY_DN1711_c0_g1_i6.p1 TRINITY_DN1711_c0_g1~~TRINITY_DN1711_c0_g1_i6.p1  ORF type:complete len:314 (+),score=66.67 TRINITY_DN1711_c0_g1_i6:135-1076(+)
MCIRDRYQRRVREHLLLLMVIALFRVGVLVCSSLVCTMAALPLANHWFKTEELPHLGTPYKVFRTREFHETAENDGDAANYYLLQGTTADMLVDAGMNFLSLADHLRIAGLLDGTKPLFAIGTHEHFDHATGLKSFENIPNTQIMLGAADADPVANGDIHRTYATEVRTYSLSPDQYWDASPYQDAAFEAALRNFSVQARIDRRLVHGDVLDVGEASFEVLELPGHTPGSIGLYDHHWKLLFTGDAAYAGELIDRCMDSNKTAYRETMLYLKTIELEAALPGHYEVLNQTGLASVCDCYLGGQVECALNVSSY